jgi:hypothetical protein
MLKKIFTVGFIRALLWMLLMMALAILVTCLQLLIIVPSWAGLDPNFWLAQKLVSYLAIIGLWPFSRVEIVVRGR